MPDVYFCEIVDNVSLTDAVFSITVKDRKLAAKSAAGQFLHVKCGEAQILRRPISICRTFDDKINFVFEVKGEGTRWLAGRTPGQVLNVLGPLGRPFSMPAGKLVVVGGGVGTPPMLFAAESAKNTVTAVLGFRSADRIILEKEFNAVCDDVYITTDDGSAGIHGMVTEPLERLLKSGEYDAVMSCGQVLMQRAVARVCERYTVPCQVSLEARMGCGVGACLVCACALKVGGQEVMGQVCNGGPVFSADMVDWEKI